MGEHKKEGGNRLRYGACTCVYPRQLRVHRQVRAAPTRQQGSNMQ